MAAVGLAAGVGDVGTAAVAALLTLGYLVALRPAAAPGSRTWRPRDPLHPGRDARPRDRPEDLLRRVDGVEGVSLRLRGIEKCDGPAGGLVDVRGRPEAAVCR